MRKVSFLLTSLIFAVSSFAQSTITDVFGREIQLELPVSKLILTEGRQFYLLAALAESGAADMVAGWRPDLKSADPLNYGAFSEYYPSLASKPEFGRFGTDGFDLELAVALQPDAVLVNVSGDSPEPQQEVINKLNQFGIPVIFVDFRHDIVDGVDKTIDIYGQLTGSEIRAERFAAFRDEAIAEVTDRLAATEYTRPTVFIERIAGYSDDCCATFGTENLGRVVQMAGGINVASKFVDGVFGKLDPEQVIVSNPAHIIATSADWQAYVPGGKWIPVGPGADIDVAREKLTYYPTKPAYQGTTAVAENNFHAVWHGFYTSPFQFVALQQTAKWLHPDLFADLDPDATFAELYQQFLPIEFQSGYTVSLTDDQ